MNKITPVLYVTLAAVSSSIGATSPVSAPLTAQKSEPALNVQIKPVQINKTDNQTPVEHFYYNFDDGLIPSNMIKPDDADATWVISNEKSRSGEYSISEGDIDENGTTVIEMTVNTVEGLFAWSLNKSIDNTDELIWTKNGSNRRYDSGEWSYNSAYLLAGENTIRFEIKNTDINSSVWIDDIAFFSREDGDFQDLDNDGMLDYWEHKYRLNFSVDDAGNDEDSDGLTNLEEFTHGGDPHNTDTDGDGLSDGDEVHVYGTRVNHNDSDFDKMPDNWEIQYGLNPTVKDDNEDLDGDGVSNLDEYLNGTNPADSSSFPAIIVLEQVNFNDYKIPNQWQQANDDQGYWRLQKNKGIDGGVAIAPSNYDAKKITLERTGYFSEGNLYAVVKGMGGDNRSSFGFSSDEIIYATTWTNKDWEAREYKIGKGTRNIELYWRGNDDTITRNQEFWIDQITFIADGSDNDSDGILDQYEIKNGMNFHDPNDANLDLDNDGLTNFEEFELNTKANDSDTDNDGLTDGQEVNQYQTNPFYWDTDLDNMSDIWEVTYGFDPITNSEETDSDGDYYSDYQEYYGDTNPRDPLSFPQGIAVTFESFEQEELPENFYIDTFSRYQWASGNTTEASDGEASLSTTVARYGRSNIYWYGNFTKGGFSFDYKLTGGSLDVYVGFEHIATLNTVSEQWQSFHHRVPSGYTWVDLYFESNSQTSQEYSLYIDNVNYFPDIYDSDGDGMPDIWELDYQFDRNDPSDADLDADGDGVTNGQEYLYGVNPRVTDSDGDGMSDGYEVANQLDPSNADDALFDADNDGIDNITEFNLGLNPQNANDAHTDLDNDGFSNLQEILGGSDPLDPNSVPTNIASWIFFLLNDEANTTSTSGASTASGANQ